MDGRTMFRCVSNYPKLPVNLSSPKLIAAYAWHKVACGGRGNTCCGHGWPAKSNADSITTSVKDSLLTCQRVHGAAGLWVLKQQQLFLLIGPAVRAVTASSWAWSDCVFQRLHHA